jgi:plasmid stabilization system protein ParE
LTNTWSDKTKNHFLNLLTKKVSFISQNPEMYPKSDNMPEIRKCVVTKQSLLFYQINQESQSIEIISIQDARSNPNCFLK